MRAALLIGHGGPDQLVCRDDVPVPLPGPGDVLVRVQAAAVNNTDINTRMAWYSKGEQDSVDASWSGNPLHFPRVQGADVCGEIVHAGTEVGNHRVGERVLIEPCIREANGQILQNPWYFGSECDGGFAEYAVVASRHAHTIESTLTSIDLASFPCAYSTAENMLTRAFVSDEDRVLITSASGGVGSAAIQLAKARGAEVFAVTRESKFSGLLEIGADGTAERESDLISRFGKNSFDVVIDLVAGPTWSTLLDLLRPGGRYTVSGAIAGSIIELDVRTLYLKDLNLFGCTVLAPEVFKNLVDHIEKRRVVPLVAEVYPLSQIAQAQKSFESKQHIGKIVLDIATRT
ncbi:MAG: alcohol dehydrogenase family protein [Pseudomonadota bacterium]